MCGPESDPPPEPRGRPSEPDGRSARAPPTMATVRPSPTPIAPTLRRRARRSRSRAASPRSKPAGQRQVETCESLEHVLDVHPSVSPFRRLAGRRVRVPRGRERWPGRFLIAIASSCDRHVDVAPITTRRARSEAASAPSARTTTSRASTASRSRGTPNLRRRGEARRRPVVGDSGRTLMRSGRDRPRGRQDRRAGPTAPSPAGTVLARCPPPRGDHG